MATENKSGVAPPPPSYNQATDQAYIPPLQTAYPPPTQAGYPPPAQAGYPPPAQAGYPPPAQAGYPPPAQTGYPQPVQGGQYPPPSSVDSPSSQPFMSSASSPSDPQSAPTESSPMGSKPWDDDVSFTGQSFSDKAIRRAFIRKVYLILLGQLLVTIAFIVFFLFYKPVQLWVWNNVWFYYISYATFLVTYITLVCCPSVRRKWPGNFICLGVFTLAFSYMTATISSMYDTKVVLIAAGITAAVCLSISIFAIQTKIDFTMCSGLLFALCMVVFFFGWSCLIVYLTWGPSYILQCVYGALAALLFAMFLAYDTQMLIGGRKYQLSPEEYIFGSLQLYLDIVYLFLIILSLFGGKD